MGDLFAPTQPPAPFALPTGEGFGWHWNERLKGYDVDLPGGMLFYAEHFFPAAWSDRMVAYLQENQRQDWRTTDWRDVPGDRLDDLGFTNIRWKQDSLKLYGKSIPLPRLTAWYGDPGAAYTYSGIKSDPNPWNDGLLHIKNRIESVVGDSYNCVLLNWYRDGQDSLNWHADDERELGPNPTIASVNFGQTRDFLLRRNDDHQQKLSIPLPAGCLLIMAGELQQHWQHAVPVRKRVTGSRFNLTFRWIHGA